MPKEFNNSSGPAKILIVKPSSLGDIIQSLPVAAALKRNWPQVRLEWLVNDNYRELLDLCSDIDRTIPFPRYRWGRIANWKKTIKEFNGLVTDIRRSGFDLVIDLQGLFRTGLLTGLSGAGKKIGFQKSREFAWLFYSDRVFLPAAKQNALRRYLALAGYLGVPAAEPSFHLAIPQPLQSWAEKKWPGPKVRLAVCPGSRWPSKRWPAGKFIQLINELNQPVILIGDNNDEQAAAQIANQVKVPVINLVARTNLPELAAILATCQLLITNDSGPMHLAAALDKNVVALFGPTAPALTGPWGRSHIILQSKISCVPCFRRHCIRQQPDTGEGGCLENITVAQVKQAVEELLSR